MMKSLKDWRLAVGSARCGDKMVLPLGLTLSWVQDLEDRKDELEKKSVEFNDSGGLDSDKFKISVGYIHSF